MTVVVIELASFLPSESTFLRREQFRERREQSTSRI
jgi:hypothetical protein